MKTKTIIEAADEKFTSNMLEIGEMMQLEGMGSHTGEIIISTFTCFVSLSNPRHTWTLGAVLPGRKLFPGEGITLIQE